MDLLVSISLGLLAALHLLPAIAAIAPARISSLYGVASNDAVMLTLLQHRAVLLGLVGLSCLAAIFLPDLAWAALAAALINMVSFIVIAALRGASQGPLKKIVIADAIGLPIAAVAAFGLLRI